ncbi:MAG TPA: 50S ribosomal protein L15 [Candidatus Binataceae bacterium]|nr:50S ribosomal protein L15 [Candidatus Binataceae bacterium]
MNLGNLKPAKGSTKKHVRVGRGIGSGLGKTSGRGHKGKGARTGGNTPPTYEGGQMPLQRRIPKRGFRRLLKNKKHREEFVIVNLKQLAEFADGATIDSAALIRKNLAKPGLKIKILGDGELNIRLNVRADAFSQGARDKIAKAGGTAELTQQAATP